ncbi:MAG: hypothetical protein PW843_04460 [Azospirillaceae bacterium]|nr:hypothetical protein [Azospirillaceae bacterium]
MAIVPAGFDKLSALGKLSTDTVITSGLGNCIGIVCINTAKQSMAIAHYNTLFTDGLMLKDAARVAASLTKLRRWLEGQTTATSFQIGVGGCWYDVAASNEPMRHALLVGLTNVFQNEPTVWGQTVRYVGGRLEGSPNADWVNNLDWSKAGTSIPYSQLR